MNFCHEQRSDMNNTNNNDYLMDVIIQKGTIIKRRTMEVYSYEKEPLKPLIEGPSHSEIMFCKDPRRKNVARVNHTWNSTI